MAIGKHYGLDDLDWIDLGDTGWRRAAITLTEGETAINPASTKHVIYGPATLMYQRAPDGGITLYEDN